MDIDNAVYLGRPLRGLGAIPSGGNVFNVGSTITFVVGVYTGSTPSLANAKRALMNTIDKSRIADTISVTSTTFSDDYDVVFNIKRAVPFLQLSNMVKNAFKYDLGVTVVVKDVITGSREAPSLFSTIASPLSKVAEFTSSMTSSVKWIVIAGVVGFGLYYVGPMIRGVGKRINK